MGVYGQVAAGGQVGGFFRPAPNDRAPARDKKRSDRIGRAGRADVAVSERLAALASTGRVDESANDPTLSPALRHRLNARLAEVLGQWRATPPGGRLVLTWPDALTIRHGRVPAR